MACCGSAEMFHSEKHFRQKLQLKSKHTNEPRERKRKQTAINNAENVSSELSMNPIQDETQQRKHATGVGTAAGAADERS